MRLFVTIFNTVLAVTYPLAVWWCLTHTSARRTGFILMLLLVPGVALKLKDAGREDAWAVLRVPLVILSVLLLGAITDDSRFVLMMPVLINLGLLVSFGVTLRAGGVPMIERFARLQDPNLDAPRQAHCRQWTWGWCGFFVANAAAAGVLALAAPIKWWAAYTSGIAYALMGVMFAIELIQRRYRFREYGRGPHDRLLARLWPPPATEPPPDVTDGVAHD